MPIFTLREWGTLPHGEGEGCIQEHFAERLAAAGTRGGRQLFRRKVVFGLEVRAGLYRELSALLQAGLPLADALEMLIASPGRGMHQTRLAGIRVGSDQVRP